jgi:hypothetical protein
LIDFRYHVVSLVAVLLALATGILVGSSVVEGPLLQRLTKTTDLLRDHTDDLQRQVQDLERGQRFASAFAQQVAPELVAGQLTGETVALISLPSANADAVEATADLIEQAGGQISSRVKVNSNYADAAQENGLNELVTQLAPAGIEWPNGANVYDRAGIELALALVTPQFVPAAQPLDASATQLLAGYQQADLIDLAEDPTGPATMAVLIAGTPSGADAATQRSAGAYLSLARALDEQSRGVVVAGTEESATERGVVSAIRANSDVANVVSTIDVADSPIGRIGVVYALEEQSRGDSGQYGIAGTTDGPLPDLTKEGQQ